MSTTSTTSTTSSSSEAPSVSVPPLTGNAKIWGSFALAMATFMNVLDTSIANVSIPAMAGDLGVSNSQGTWVITSFAVANAIALPLTGWLTQRFGAVRLFVSAIILFTLASLLCGLSQNIQMLIAFRVIQGAVAGPLIPLSQTLLLSSFPREKSGIALALWSMTTLIAPVVGPVLGGWITDTYAWPWIFYLNIPIGIFCSWTTWTIYRKRETPTRKVPIDGVGLALLVVWVGALQIMLDKGKELDWFHSSQIVVLALIASTAFCFFVVWELFDNDHPVVDLSLFTRRNFVTGTILISVGYGVFFGNLVILPLWLQTQMGFTATWAGWMAAPIGVLAAIITPFVGQNIGRVDPRRLICVSFLIFAAVSFMRAAFNTQVDIAHLLVPTFIQGVAMALFFIPLMSIIFSGLQPERFPSASGLCNFVRITAGAFCASVSSTLWEDRAVLHHAQLVENIVRTTPSTAQVLSNPVFAGADESQVLAFIERSLDQQAHMLGVNDVFWLSGIIFCAMAVLVWTTTRPATIPPSAQAAAAH